jgi:hypothetical protein
VPGGGTWCGFGPPNDKSDRIGISVHILSPGDSQGFVRHPLGGRASLPVGAT